MGRQEEGAEGQCGYWGQGDTRGQCQIMRRGAGFPSRLVRARGILQSGGWEGGEIRSSLQDPVV